MFPLLLLLALCAGADSESRRPLSVEGTAVPLPTTSALEPARSSSLPKLDLVFSHYHEPISEVIAFVNRSVELLQHVQLARIYLYTHTDQALAGVPSGWIVHVAHYNMGRESENYLTFLVEHLHDVNELVWFSQSRADGYMQDKLWKRLPLITERTGMLGLSIWETVDCSAGIYPGLGELIREVYAMVHHQFCHGQWTAFFNGEFVVSRARLQKHTTRFYKMLRDDLDLPASESWIHLDMRPAGLTEAERMKSTPTNPALGYALERTWNVIWRCEDPPVPCCVKDEPCPVDSCQCLDVPGIGHLPALSAPSPPELYPKDALPKVVWLLWLDGWESVPPVVDAVRKSWQFYNPTWEVRLLNRTSVDLYVDVPYLWRDDIQYAAKSDIIRLSLLAKHGGVWADATMLCLAPLDDWLPAASSPAGYFAYVYGSIPCPCSWFLAAEPNSLIAQKWKQRADTFWAESYESDYSGGGLPVRLNASHVYHYFWMDNLFREMYTSDQEMQALWSKVPSVPCNQPFGPASRGSHGALSLPDLEAGFRSAMPNVIKLTRHSSSDDETMLLMRLSTESRRGKKIPL